MLRVGMLIFAFFGAAIADAQDARESNDDIDSTAVISDDLTAAILDAKLRDAAAFLEAGTPVAAAGALRDILLQNPAHTQALRLLTSAYLRAEIFDRALEVCRQLSVHDSTDASVWIALGYLHQRLGDMTLAEQFYQQGLVMDPDVIAAYQGLGWIYLTTGHLEQALDMVDETTARAPDYAPNYILMGRVLTVQGFFEDAAIAYNRAFALQNDLREQYGILLQELGLRHRLGR